MAYRTNRDRGRRSNPPYESSTDRERQWRRFDEDEEFRNRPGALDRRWGYGERLAPGYRRADRPSEYDFSDPYNAPAHWHAQEEWMRPGPYTGYGPKGYRRSDERIHEEVCDRLTQHAGIDASEVELEVQDGEVTVSGTVQDRRMKRLVEANIERISGVVDVHNRLRLRREPTREELAREKTARYMAERFPGGPEPSGNAGFDEPDRG